MKITVKPLTPELTSDYLDFFDNRAFSDRKGAFCYCTWFHFICTIEEYYENGQDAMRNQAIEYIADGKLNGYLAFADGIPVGWCNADNKAVYRRLDEKPYQQNGSNERIKSIVCFTIAPEHRGKGIATALLNAVVEDARINAYTAVESYPGLHDEHEPYDYAGPIHLYEKAGFIEAVRENNKVVMRKVL